jgi:hypothetical protein
MVDVVVDPRARFAYAWFYICGLREVFGPSNVHLGSSGFSGLSPEGPYSFDHYFAFTVERDGVTTRYVVDYRDLPVVDAAAYAWSDVYGAVNLTEEIGTNTPKSRAIGPGFGVGPSRLSRLDVRFATASFLSHAHDRRRLGASLVPGKRRLLIEQVFWRRMPSILDFSPEASDPHYIFYAATLWEHDNCIASTNPLRADFMRAARATATLRFEGGFFLQGDHPQSVEFEDLLLERRFTMKDWTGRTARSALVFNNAAVHGCLGWKLAQFLCMGKAIVSTEIDNVLPQPLVHGVHVHFVKDPSEIPGAIRKITTDDSYRRRLEKGARSYWDDFLTPTNAIRRLTSSAATLGDEFGVRSTG